jgi:hypothetical protein
MRIESRTYTRFLRPARPRVQFDPLRPSGLNRPSGISGREIPPVEAWPVTGRNGQVELITKEERKKRLGEGRITYAFNPKTKLDYLVAEEVFDDHAGNIYRYESQQALFRIERFCRSHEYPHIDLRMKLFQRVESAVIERSLGSPGNYRHLSFMLRELAEMGCDFLTATAALLHNLPRKEAERIMLAGQKTNDALRKTAKQILDLVQVFNNINGIPYSPPPKRLQHHIQNFMDSLIKISQGNGGALLLFFIHKLSSLTMQTEDAADITFKCVEEFVAPSAERVGMIGLASKLRNEAFRLHEPELYRKTEADILASLGLINKEEAELYSKTEVDILVGLGLISKEVAELHSQTRADTLASLGLISKEKLESFHKAEADILARLRLARKKAEDLADETKQALIKTFTDTEHKSFLVEARAKTAFDAWKKMKRKPEEYPEPLCMEDLIGARAVTSTLPSLAEAKRIIRQAWGDALVGFIDKQTEIKVHKIIGGNIRVIHLGVILNDRNPREIQILDQENYKTYERGYLSHWARNLEESTDQKFDREFLESCASEMTGDILNDAKVIHAHLKPWVYVFFQDEKHDRVIRCLKGSIPIDVLSWIEGHDFSKYTGFNKRKIWNDRGQRTKEDLPLEDGDFLELDTPIQLGEEYLTLQMRRELLNLSKDPLTKVILHFFGDEDELREAARRGEEKFINVSGKPSNRFFGFKEFALRRYQMNTRELLAAIELKILSPEEILDNLNQFFLAELASK